MVSIVRGGITSSVANDNTWLFRARHSPLDSVQFGEPWCLAESPFQGHVFWQFMTAMAAGLQFVYRLSEHDSLEDNESDSGEGALYGSDIHFR
jgi:hypothetical protein